MFWIFSLIIQIEMVPIIGITLYLLIGILHSYQEVLGIFPERFIVGHIPIIFFYRQGKMNIYLLCFEIRLIKTLQMYIFKPVI